ncbi:MAG: Hsp70 family protein [Candidatus Sumerlaeia bacterium]|nr:Hsp70 family protein [Candidatus Sumerlaeia bacterium]
MSAPNARYVVGIDLGTSNSALAYAPMPGDGSALELPKVELLKVDQVAAPGSVEARELLPSVLYVRGEAELPEGALQLPWRADPGYCVGAFAREQGARIASRMIHSAKSWLSHSGVDRQARFLPFQSREEDAKRSPVEVSTALLEHFRAAWNHRMAQGDASTDLAEQDIVLCVPASFDAAARSLTMEAATAAGLRHVSLLEEPQAAFHSWIERAGEDWRKRVRVGDIVLVVDVGGGTTDFSLIAVSDAGGELELRRLAVGEHILLGGDNMDLALAYGVAANLEAERGRKLDPAQMAALVQQCRQGKEALLADPSLAAHPIAILGKGSSVVGGTIRTELRREGLEQMLVDGFFPRCALGDRPARAARAGFREAGLPYASDPAVTLHLARFLGQQHEAARELFPGLADKGALLPTAILFNGGVFKAQPLQQRVLEVVASWCQGVGQEPPRVLEGAELDLAVSRGAAYLGLAKRGKGVRIRGGSPRAYYIGIESAAPAVPGMKAPLKAMCVVPYGMEEGTSATIDGREADLCVWTGEPAAFRFLSSTTRRHDAPGSLTDVDAEQFEEHQAIETTLPAKGGEPRPAEVDLRAELTEIGVLNLSCVERGDDHEYRLEFNVRHREG